MSINNMIDKFMQQQMTKFLKLCIAFKIENPRITIEAHVKDGGNYKLIFERTDLDEATHPKTPIID